MAEGTDWYPSERPKQRAMYANFLAKIDNYKDVIQGLPDMTARLKLICQMYIGIYDWLEQTSATSGETYQWRSDMETGDKSETVQPPPVFQVLTLPADAFKGFVTEFREKIGLLKRLDGYTPAIGADLMIVREKSESLNLTAVRPELTYTVLPNYKVRAAGKMRGLAAVKFYYRRKGTTEWLNIGFLTKLPGEIQITPAQTGVPEVGDLRAVFTENNTETGQFSDNSEVTLS